MLDAIRVGLNGQGDGVRRVSMNGHLQAVLVSFVDDCAHDVVRHRRDEGISTRAQLASGRDDLDHVHAPPLPPADDEPSRVGIIHDSAEVVEVSIASRERGSGGQDLRAGGRIGCDLIAETQC